MPRRNTYRKKVMKKGMASLEVSVVIISSKIKPGAGS